MNLAPYLEPAFFEWHVPLAEPYRAIGRELSRLLEDPAPVLDLGCGNGYLLDGTRAMRRVGVDVSPLAKRYLPVTVKFIEHDLTKPLFLGWLCPLVICTEVAEHLPPEAASTLLGTIAAHASRWVYFTAATIGQGGEGHLNEQPHEYWKERFLGFDFDFDEEKSLAMRRFAGTTVVSWLRDNSMVFKKRGEHVQ